MPSRRAVLRRGGAMFGVGSVATVGTLASRSDSKVATGTASVLVAGSFHQVANRIGDASVEAHGSVACRRLLEDGLRDPDAVALADPRLFDGLAERVTCFATNALVVAVDPDSPGAAYADRSEPGEYADRSKSAERNAGEYGDWRALLADSDVSLGRTDPEQDPLGYRTVMALRLARGIDAESVLTRTTVHPETGLLRTLEVGGVDAAFAYRNMAVEHDLLFLELPDCIDFSTPALAEEYATAEFDLDEETVVGSPIRYAASARTERGWRWVRTIADAGDSLRDAGFGIPRGYPEEREVRSYQG